MLKRKSVEFLGHYLLCVFPSHRDFPGTLHGIKQGPMKVGSTTSISCLILVNCLLKKLSILPKNTNFVLISFLLKKKMHFFTTPKLQLISQNKKKKKEKKKKTAYKGIKLSLRDKMINISLPDHQGFVLCYLITSRVCISTFISPYGRKILCSKYI